jgi:rubrerythrin
MFIIAGVSPKITVLDETPSRCPVCGLNQAYYKRIDHYFNLFFIPLFRVKKGDPVLMCEKCERNIHDMGPEYTDWIEKQDLKCRRCGRAVHRDFAYCPHCGEKI